MGTRRRTLRSDASPDVEGIETIIYSYALRLRLSDASPDVEGIETSRL